MEIKIPYAPRKVQKELHDWVGQTSMGGSGDAPESRQDSDGD